MSGEICVAAHKLFSMQTINIDTVNRFPNFVNLASPVTCLAYRYATYTRDFLFVGPYPRTPDDPFL